MILQGILLFCVGVGATYCAYRDFDWYMQFARVPFPMGRVGARRFHIGIGILLVILSIVFLFAKNKG